MAGIQPTQGLGPSHWPKGLSGPAEKPTAGGQGFGQVLKSCIGQADQAQQASYEAISQMLSGRGQDVLPVVNAVAKADLSFKLLLGVRNKVIEAYKQTMNMQV